MVCFLGKLFNLWEPLLIYAEARVFLVLLWSDINEKHLEQRNSCYSADPSLVYNVPAQKSKHIEYILIHERLFFSSHIEKVIFL